jgi:hypothetical protein
MSGGCELFAFDFASAIFVVLCGECDDTGIQLTFNLTSGDLLPSFPVKWSQNRLSYCVVMHIQPAGLC